MGIFQHSPVFIISSPKSGSTFLYQKLRELPGVYAFTSDPRVIDFYHKVGKKPFKEHKEELIDSFIQHYKKRDVANKSTIHPQTLKEELLEHASSWQDLFEWTAYHEGLGMGRSSDEKGLMLEKTPYNIYHAVTINELYPQARFIRLVRDPRAVVASLNTRAWSGHNTVANAHQWKKEVRLLEEFSPSISIRYEDLVEFPMQAKEQIYAFIYGDGPRDQQFRPKEEEMEEKPDQQGVSRKGKDKWKRTLSRVDQELEIIESICENEMERYGYTLKGGPRTNKYYRTYFHYWLDHQIGRIGKFFKK